MSLGHWPQAKDRLRDYFYLARHGRGSGFCIWLNGKIIGFIFCESMHYHGKKLWIGEFAIAAKYQGQGHGLEVLRFIEKFARSKKFKALVLAASVKAHAFNIYKKFGFKQGSYVLMDKEL